MLDVNGIINGLHMNTAHLGSVSCLRLDNCVHANISINSSVISNNTAWDHFGKLYLPFAASTHIYL